MEWLPILLFIMAVNAAPAWAAFRLCQRLGMPKLAYPLAITGPWLLAWLFWPAPHPDIKCGMDGLLSWFIVLSSPLAPLAVLPWHMLARRRQFEARVREEILHS